MRRRSKLALSPWLVLAILPIASARLPDDSNSPSINLSQFQPIYGFSPACTAAYDTPIPGCTGLDFTGSDPCSASCINGLNQITALLDSACQGTEADPTTLIGLFFAGKGVGALCLNAGGSTTTQASGAGASSSSTAVVSSVTPISKVPSSTGILPSSASFTLGSSSASSDTLGSTSISAASMSSSAIPSSATSQTSSTSTTGSSSPTAPPTKTPSSNPDQFGGGGSPFEVSGGAMSRRNMSWMLYGLGIGVFAFCIM